MFEYIHQVNKRAKRIKLQFCSYRGLIISSPKTLSKKRLDALCLEHKNWIQTQQLKYPIKSTQLLPNDLKLTALTETYVLTFETSDKNKTIEDANKLIIQGKNNEQQKINLKRFIRKKAKLFFTKKLDDWANKTQLNYSKLSVRSQKSRWGSCSSSASISLNDQLLFMPESVLDYIIVHELCHTVHPNHSAQYWSLVNHHYPDFKQQEFLLAQYAKKIPPWFRASLYQ